MAGKEIENDYTGIVRNYIDRQNKWNFKAIRVHFDSKELINYVFKLHDEGFTNIVPIIGNVDISNDDWWGFDTIPRVIRGEFSDGTAAQSSSAAIVFNTTSTIRTVVCSTIKGLATANEAFSTAAYPCRAYC